MIWLGKEKNNKPFKDVLNIFSGGGLLSQMKTQVNYVTPISTAEFMENMVRIFRDAEQVTRVPREVHYYMPEPFIWDIEPHYNESAQSSSNQASIVRWE